LQRNQCETDIFGIGVGMTGDHGGNLGGKFFAPPIRRERRHAWCNSRTFHAEKLLVAQTFVESI
jgi:hypothetical protein